MRPLLDELAGKVTRNQLHLIQRAYDTAEKWHKDQYRYSGEPYITHPVAVAVILTQMGAGITTIAAGLLHDTLEDTDYTFEEITNDFGEEVATLVKGVTKLDRVSLGDVSEAETIRKMVIAMSKDIRVLLIKLADRLHNARTWSAVPATKAARKAKQTLEIYAPLAHRVGMQALKNELEDLSFRILHPDLYREIANLVNNRQPEQAKYLKDIESIINQDLSSIKIRGSVYGRKKEIYSIYQKMVVKEKEFDDIYDLLAVRVIVDSVRDCYATLGAIHARWIPLPGRFKDYIAIPKSNLYQSLHTTVVGPFAKTVEIQIRTQEMHYRAEYGVAAHWLYKQNRQFNQSKLQDESAIGTALDELPWIKKISDLEQETQDSSEFLYSLRTEIGANEVYVFTPKGRAIELPQFSTPIDFAYCVHTDVGHSTVGAKVNGKLVPLETKLQNGDIVEILTSKSKISGPKLDWLKIVVSARAKSKIKAWFSKERRETALEIGRELATRAMRKARISFNLDEVKNAITSIAHNLQYADTDTLYIAIGQGHISVQSFIEKLESILRADTGSIPVINPNAVVSAPRKPQPGNKSASAVNVHGYDSILTKLAKCCTPVFGDDIVGFITRGSGVSVHRKNCKNIAALELERVVDVSWSNSSADFQYLVRIQVEALDRPNLIVDVTRVLSEHKIGILSANMHTSKDRVAILRFSFELLDPSTLERALNALHRLDGVYSAKRVVE